MGEGRDADVTHLETADWATARADDVVSALLRQPGGFEGLGMAAEVQRMHLTIPPPRYVTRCASSPVKSEPEDRWPVPSDSPRAGAGFPKVAEIVTSPPDLHGALEALPSLPDPGMAAIHLPRA